MLLGPDSQLCQDSYLTSRDKPNSNLAQKKKDQPFGFNWPIVRSNSSVIASALIYKGAVYPRGVQYAPDPAYPAKYRNVSPARFPGRCYPGS